MVLGASYGSLAGGFGTEIGTAHNLMAAAYTYLICKLDDLWISACNNMLFVTWKLLGWIFPQEVKGIVGGMDTITNTRNLMGLISKTEKITR
jgi:sodium-dependent dicarboxylate transporter 2/3/5